MDIPERQERAFGYVVDGAEAFDREMERRAQDPQRSDLDKHVDEILKLGAQMAFDYVQAVIRAAHPTA